LRYDITIGLLGKDFLLHYAVFGCGKFIGRRQVFEFWQLSISRWTYDADNRRGDYPEIAPLGYLNDVRIKKIVIDRKRSKIVRQAFELYFQGDQRLEDIAAFFAKNGIVAKCKKPLHLSRITFILSNPFYYGLFRYSGELHEGNHEPIISKKIFDKVQEVLKQCTHIYQQTGK